MSDSVYRLFVSYVFADIFVVIFFTYIRVLSLFYYCSLPRLYRWTTYNVYCCLLFYCYF